MHIYTPETIPYDGLVYSAPKKVGNRYYMCVEEEKGGKVLVQTPKLVFTNMPSEGYVTTHCDADTWNDCIKQVDDFMMDTIKKNCTEWFGENHGMDDTFFEVGRTPSLMRNDTFKLRYNKDVTLYDCDKNELSVDELNLERPIKCIVQLVGLWFTKTRWGVSWKVVQGKVYKPKTKKSHGYLFPDDPADIEDDEDLHPPPGVE